MNTYKTVKEIEDLGENTVAALTYLTLETAGDFLLLWLQLDTYSLFFFKTSDQLILLHVVL